jgi:hypothetical protein
MEPPSGGPVDTRAPAVAAVYPAPGARSVPLDAPVVIQFSEWIDRTVARNQAFVSPPARGKLRVVAEGDKLQVQPSEVAGGWRPRTTYQVTVLPTLQDLHGVKAGRPFILRFSTGPDFDSATVSGRAIAFAPTGRMMAALYRSGGTAGRVGAEPFSARDASFMPGAAPEPWRELPAALALADSTGAFRFDSVAQGDYALLAFEDVNGNFTYDYGFENAAVGPLSLALRPRAEAPPLSPVAIDTLPLRIASGTFVSETARDTAAAVWRSGKIRVEFTRAPHPLRAAEASRYRLLPDSGAALPAASMAWSPIEAAWMLDAGPLSARRSYRIEMRARPDFPGRDGGGPDTSLSFTVGEVRDTTDWRLAFVQTSAATLLPGASSQALPGRDFVFATNRPLSPARWKSLNDRLEARIDSAAAPRVLSLVNPFTFSIKLLKPAPAGARLDLVLRPGPGDTSAKTLGSLAVADSTLHGGIRFTPPSRFAGWVFRLEAENGSWPVPSESVPVGRYRLFGFRDEDKDGVWNPGALKPWIPQEPHARLLDSVSVKPGAATDLTPRLESIRK